MQPTHPNQPPQEDQKSPLTNPLLKPILVIAIAITLILSLAIATGMINLSDPYETNPPPENGTPCLGQAECFNDTVTKIVDGDTLYVGDVKVRLALVDTPEVGEVGYEEATQFAGSLCPVGSEAWVDQDDRQLYDAYGRMLAVVYCGGKNLNEELLEGGYAVILTRYCDESEFGGEGWARR
ncbi:MAG: hypothetical protein E3J35_04305, partial [Methanomassiliicoccales archaeon]